MKYFILAISLILITACKPYKINASRAHLFKADCKMESENENCKLTQITHPDNTNAAYGGNPIVIAADTKFSIVLDKIKPPKLFYKKITENLTSYVNNKYLINSIRQQYGPLSDHVIENNIRNKQLWLLTTIKSQNLDDPLEANSKIYSKSTQVKWDMGSHLLVPLDKDEKIIFTHDSDVSYKISFQLMEVDSLALKKEIAVLRNQTGILNLLEVGVNTFLDLFNTVLGKEYILNRVDATLKNDTAFQRFLLSIGATVEFQGEFLIYRDTETFKDQFPEKIFKTNEFYLIDGFRLNKRKNIYPINKQSKENFEIFKWNDGEKEIDIKINAGGLKNKDNELITMESLNLLDGGDDPGFMSFKVHQIPNRQAIEGESILEGINHYYDFNKVEKLLNETSNDLFTEIYTKCYGIIKINKAAFFTNNTEVDDICHSYKHLLGMPYLKSQVSQNFIKPEIDEYSSNLKSMLLDSDFYNYRIIDKEYSNLGIKLNCIEGQAVDSNKCNAENDAEDIRLQKNILYNQKSNLKADIINILYKNISLTCSMHNSLTFNIKDIVYNCNFFNEISKRRIEFNQFKELFHRQND